MDTDRFDMFRRESEVLIDSQNWLTYQMDKAIEEYENLPTELSDNLEVEHDLAAKMEFLELKAQWEQRESERFAKKYSDII